MGVCTVLLIATEDCGGIITNQMPIPLVASKRERGQGIIYISSMVAPPHSRLFHYVDDGTVKENPIHVSCYHYPTLYQ